MGAEIHVVGRELAQGRQCGSSVLHRRIVWLVSAEETPHRFNGPFGMTGIDLYDHGKRIGSRGRIGSCGSENGDRRSTDHHQPYHDVATCSAGDEYDADDVVFDHASRATADIMTRTGDLKGQRISRGLLKSGNAST